MNCFNIKQNHLVINYLIMHFNKTHPLDDSETTTVENFEAEEIDKLFYQFSKIKTIIQ